VTDPAGRRAHAEHHVLHLQRAQVLVVDRGDDLAGHHLPILHELFDGVDRGKGRPGLFERLHHLIKGRSRIHSATA
jgi:hypothetical protein